MPSILNSTPFAAWRWCDAARRRASLPAETIGITAGLAGVGLLALVTGRSMNSDYHSSGLADCLAGGSESQCRELVEQFGDKFNSLQFLIVPLVLLPALLGALRRRPVGCP